MIGCWAGLYFVVGLIGLLGTVAWPFLACVGCSGSWEGATVLDQQPSLKTGPVDVAAS